MTTKKASSQQGASLLLRFGIRLFSCGGVLSCSQPLAKQSNTYVVEELEKENLPKQPIVSENGSTTLLPTNSLSSSEPTVTVTPAEANPWKSTAGKIWLLFSLSIIKFGVSGTYQALSIEIWPYQVEVLLGTGNAWKSLVAGVLVGTMGLVGLFTAPTSGRLGDRTGHKRRITFWGILLACCCIMSMSLWVPGMIGNVWTILPVVALCQVGLNAANVNAESLMPAVLPFSYLPLCASLKGVLQVVGESFGQFTISYLITLYPERFVLFYGLVCLMLFLTMLPAAFGTRVEASAQSGPSKTGQSTVADPVYVRNKWLIISARFFVMGSVHGFLPFLQYMWSEVFDKEYEGAAQVFTAYVTSTVSLCGVLGVFFGGFLSKRIGEKPPVQMGSVSVAVGMVLLGLACVFVETVAVFFGAVFVGIGVGMNLSSEQVLLVACSPNRVRMGADFGLLSASTALGCLITPTLGGLLISTSILEGNQYRLAFVGLYTLWWVFAVAAFLLILFVRVPPKPNPTQLVPV